ncbi:MAG TPA: hypothetical protein DCW68_03660 [Rhodospirillaceae bacterium]|nr:MAG: hypothetical protein A2018_07740 [Alphaproteobacteria bacterium GWF2_58_20]HAU29191.1 hypothetical protein [Rhodospirillaceae bacterium]
MSHRLRSSVLAASTFCIAMAALPALAQETFPVRLRVSNQLGQSAEQAYTLTVTTPTHSEWVYLPESNVSGFTVPAFAVSKYEMSGTSPATPAAGQLSDTYSWASCRSACQAIGPGYDMIKESQWNRITQDIVDQPANWSGGAVGSGKLFYGLSTAEASSTNDVNGYHNAPTPGYDQFNRRTMVTSTGEVLWDIAGGRGEWTYADDGRTGATGTGQIRVGINNASTGCVADSTYYTGYNCRCYSNTVATTKETSAVPFTPSTTDCKPSSSYTTANNAGNFYQRSTCTAAGFYAYITRGISASRGIFAFTADYAVTSAGCRCALNNPPTPDEASHLDTP